MQHNNINNTLNTVVLDVVFRCPLRPPVSSADAAAAADTV